MRLRDIRKIHKICDKFTEQVLDLDDAVDKETLIALFDRYCDSYTEQSDDTIDVDFDCMCFTCQKQINGDKWFLCENASYYIFKNNLGLTEVEDTIDVELD